MDELIQGAFGVIESDESFEAFKEGLRRSDRRLLLRILSDILPKLEGEYSERIVKLMEALGVVEDNIKSLKKRQWHLRVQACRALGMIKRPEVVEGLKYALEDKNIIVRLEAAKSLAGLDVKVPVKYLVDKLAPAASDYPLGVREVFQKLGMETGLELCEVIRGDYSENAKILSAEALGFIGSLNSVPVLTELVDSGSPKATLFALQALGRIGDPRGVPATMMAIHNPNWEVRAQAAKTLGMIGDPYSVSVLDECLNDESWWVRFYAAEALFKMGPKGITYLHLAAANPETPAGTLAKGYLREKLLMVA